MRTSGWFVLFLFLLTLTPLFAQQKMYWTDGRNGIFRSNTDGSELETLFENKALSVESLTIDNVNQKLYWVDRAKQTLTRSNFDGSDIEIIYNLPDFRINNLAVDPRNNKVYWNYGRGFVVYVLEIGEDTPDIFIDWNDFGFSLYSFQYSFTQEKIYFLRRNKVMRMNFDGSELEDVHEINNESGSYTFVGLRIDDINGKMYWAKSHGFTNITVVQSDLNGGNEEELFTRLTTRLLQ